jgi:geranylgeranyl pyrophosphate synthase
LGKTAGKDARANKATFVRLHGLEASRELAREYTERAKAALSTVDGDKAFLTALIDSMANRIR